MANLMDRVSITPRQQDPIPRPAPLGSPMTIHSSPIARSETSTIIIEPPAPAEVSSPKRVYCTRSQKRAMNRGKK